MNIYALAKTIHGTSNDAAFWDGWRMHDDAWAKRYLRAAVRRGADRCGSARDIAAANKALGVATL